MSTTHPTLSCPLVQASHPKQKRQLYADAKDSCRAFNRDGNPLFGAWFFYAIAIVYDVFTTSLAVFYLLRFNLRATNSLSVPSFCPSISPTD